MMLIGCDFHPSWQQVCWLDQETGETSEEKLVHASGDAEKFYKKIAGPARIGMEATGNCQWFVEMATVAEAAPAEGEPACGGVIVVCALLLGIGGMNGQKAF